MESVAAAARNGRASKFRQEIPIQSKFRRIYNLQISDKEDGGQQFSDAHRKEDSFLLYAKSDLFCFGAFGLLAERFKPKFQDTFSSWQFFKGGIKKNGT